MEHRFDLPIAPAAVRADLISEDFLQAFAAAVGVQVDSLASEASAERGQAKMLWRFRTDKPGIPELARTLLPDEVRLSWAQEWGPLDDTGASGSSLASGTLTVKLLGKPRANSQGASELLRAHGGGATLVTTTRTKASLPFPLRRRVESMIDKDLVGWILSVHARVLTGRHPSAPS